MLIAVKILKKGKKYWAAETEPKGWPCKVVINEVTKDCEPGQIVGLNAEDVGTKSKYGSTYIYDPNAGRILKDTTEVKQWTELAKKLTYAEGDAWWNEWDYSNAIMDSLDIDLNKYPEFTERITALKKKVEENRATRQIREEEENRKWKEQRTKEMAACAADPRKKVLVNVKNCPRVNRPWRLNNRVGAEIVVVTEYSQGWDLNSEDAGRYSMGSEEQRVKYAYYRDATKMEKAYLEAMEEEARKKAEAKEAHEKRLREIENMICKTGIIPNISDIEEDDLYGQIPFCDNEKRGYILINKKWIWYFKNNGSNYSDLGQALVKGDPKVTAWRIPRDEALVKELRTMFINE